MRKTYASKIIAEVRRSGGIVPIERLKEERWKTKEKGVGCLCISLEEQGFLLHLRTEEPTRSNDSYISKLLLFSGNLV